MSSGRSPRGLLVLPSTESINKQMPRMFKTCLVQTEYTIFFIVLSEQVITCTNWIRYYCRLALRFDVAIFFLRLISFYKPVCTVQ